MQVRPPPKRAAKTRLRASGVSSAAVSSSVARDAVQSALGGLQQIRAAHTEIARFLGPRGAPAATPTPCGTRHLRGPPNETEILNARPRFALGSLDPRPPKGGIGFTMCMIIGVTIGGWGTGPMPPKGGILKCCAVAAPAGAAVSSSASASHGVRLCARMKRRRSRRCTRARRVMRAEA